MHKRPTILTATTPYGGTVRVAIWEAMAGTWTVQVGGTLPRSGYSTIADTFSEALTFGQAEIAELLASQG